jgi:alpha-tubulin suppressor-like RCC1 family protein
LTSLHVQLGILCLALSWQSIVASPFAGRVIEWDFQSGVATMHTNLPPGLNDVVAVAAGGINWGYEFSLALKSDGTIVAWGDNSFGQLDVPSGLSNVIAIAAGAPHSVALKSDGTVLAWGFDGVGETDVPAGLSNVVAIASKKDHCLALKSDGTVVAWGFNNTGQINVPAGLSNVTAIAAGDIQSVGLLNDSTLVGWGQAPVPAGLSNVIAIAGGGFSDWLCRNLALKSDSTVVAWGVWDTDVPAGLTNVVGVAVGETHYLAIKNDGTLALWGHGYTGSTVIPAGVSNVVSIAGGSTHNVAIVADLKIDSLEITNQVPIIHFHTFAGQQYTVEYSLDLAQGSWTALPQGTIQGTGFEASVADTSAGGQATRFYRLKQ